MKKLLTFLIVLCVVFTAVSPAFALTTERPMVDKIKNSSTGAAITEKLADNLKERAEKEINRRIASLNKLLSRISEFKKLTATQKATLSSQVQKQIDTLNTLLAKIKTDTDPIILKTDVQSIISSYRIYALFMPQIQIIGAADRMLNLADTMSSHAAKLEEKITAAKTGGKDTTELDALLSDMKAKIADAKTKAQGAIDAVTPLTPEGFPGNRTTLQSARQTVVTALHDLNTARQDGRKIIVGLMNLGVDFKMNPAKEGKIKPSETPTPTTATP